MTDNHSGPPGIAPLDITHQDDPKVLEKAGAEDYSLHAVPLSWRSSRGSLSMAWFALMSAMFFVVVGSTVTLAVGTVDTLIGLGLSVVVYGVISDVASRYANRSGTSVALFSRAVFGQIGAAFAAGLFGLTITWYAVAEGAIVALALHEYFGGPPMAIWYLIVVAYQAPLVMRGVRVWLDKINGVLLPLYVLGLIASVIWAISEVGYSNDWLTYEPVQQVVTSVPGWWFTFTVYMGVWVVVMMAWDYARFGRNEDAKFNGRISFGMPFYLMTLLINSLVGIFLAHSIAIEGELSEASAIVAIVGLMGFWGALWVWASQTRINTANFYLASSNWQNFFARAFHLVLPRTVWLVVVAVVVYLLMLTDVLSWLLKALTYQGVVIVGWVAIVMTHIAWSHIRKIKPNQTEFRPGRVPLVNPAGMSAWLISSVVGIVLVAFAGDFGAIWAPPITCVLAAGIYALSIMFAKESWFIMRRPHDPRTEVDDCWEARVRCGYCQNAYIAYEMDRDPSNGHEPICLACASDHTRFLQSARAEADEYAASTATDPGGRRRSAESAGDSDHAGQLTSGTDG